MAAKAGTVVIALFVGNLGIKPVTTLLRRCGIRTVMLGAIVCSACCLAGIAPLRASTVLPLLAAVLRASGVGRSVGFTAYNTVAFADVPAERTSSANALMATAQELGVALGVAVGALLTRPGRPAADAFVLRAGNGAPFRVAFLLLTVVLVVPTVEALRLPRTAGATITGGG